MCQRHSVQSEQLSHPLHNNEHIIKSLQVQISQYQTEIFQKNKQLEQLSEIKRNVKKIPYNIYKEFLIATESDGSVVNLIKKKSLQNDSFISGREQSTKKQENQSSYEHYLLFRIAENKSALYISSNTEISTIQKLNLTKYTEEQRESYEYVSPDLEKHFSHNKNLKLYSKTFQYQLSQNSLTPKRAQLKQEQKQLLQFPPSKVPDLKKKESLPLRTECEILSDDLRKLKQKINAYTRVLEEKSIPSSSVVSSLKDVSQLKGNEEKIKEYMEQKAREPSPLDFDSVLQKRWKVQKQQYIDYIKNLQKQLQQYKEKLSLTEKSQFSKNYLETTPYHSQLKIGSKSPHDYQSTPYSEIRSNQTDNLQQQKYTIFKPETENVQRSYFKNQYHINSQEKSRSKSKGSKVIYLGR